MPSALPIDLSNNADTSVPFIQASDIGDNELLNATRTIDVGNGYRFEITLPSGRVLESAPVGSDYPKRDAIMQWLGAVRESIVEDAASAGRIARDAHLAEPTAPSAERQRLARAGDSVELSSADPVEYARQQLRAAIERLSLLSAAEADVAKWQRVVNSLTGETVVKRKRRKKRKVRSAVRADSAN
jgi:hypothetical protein